MVNQIGPAGLDVTTFAMPEGNRWDRPLFPVKKIDASEATFDRSQLTIAAKLAVHLSSNPTQTDKLIVVQAPMNGEQTFFACQMPASCSASKARFVLEIPSKPTSVNSYLAAIKNFAVQYCVEEVWVNPQSFIDLIEGQSKVPDKVIACLAPEIYLSSRHFPEMFGKGFICLGYCHQDVPPNTPIMPTIVRLDIPAKWFKEKNYIGVLDPSIRNGQAFPYFVPMSSVAKHLKDPGVTTLVSLYKTFRSQQKTNKISAADEISGNEKSFSPED